MPNLVEQWRAGTAIEQHVALVAAHPDDETVGLGSRLGRMRRLRIVYVTDGAPRDLVDARREGFSDWCSYAAERERELGEALRVLGAAGAQRISYACPDQQAIRKVAAITARLVDDLAGMDAVLTHPYEHGNPDHDTAALAVFLACGALAEKGVAAPQRFEFPSYHLGEGKPVYGRFWPDQSRPETLIELSPEEQRIKQAALDCFSTQKATLKTFPLSPERIRRAPEYDFVTAAPPGKALYDLYGWEIKSGQWRETAAAALSKMPAPSDESAA